MDKNPKCRTVDRLVNQSGNPTTWRPSVTIFANPRLIDIIASVAINAGSLALVTSKPLIRPQTAPQRRAIRIANGKGTLKLSFNQPITIIAKARMDPTERSIPPITMTRVMPTARIPRTVTWSRIFKALRTEKKTLVVKVKITHRRIRPRSGPWTPMTQLAQDAPFEVAMGAGASAMAFLVSLIAWDEVWGKAKRLRKALGGNRESSGNGIFTQ